MQMVKLIKEGGGKEGGEETTVRGREERRKYFRLLKQLGETGSGSFFPFSENEKREGGRKKEEKLK